LKLSLNLLLFRSSFVNFSIVDPFLIW